MAATASSRTRFARRRYLIAAACLVISVAATGWLLNTWMTADTPLAQTSAFGLTDPGAGFDEVFRVAVAQMQAGRYEQALSSWHRALQLDAEIVEVKVNMGFTLFELGHHTQAREFFIAALEQNAYQANAYYGLAIVSEKMGDLEGALGAMRSYIHLAGTDDKFIRRARAALWEWEAQLDGREDIEEKASAGSPPRER